MSLREKNCYTLSLIPSLRDPMVLELVEGWGATGGQKQDPRYGRVRERREGEAYSSVLYDGYSGAKLASAGFVADKAKQRRLELHGPDETIPFEFTGKLGFEWTFSFEGNKYHWKRDGIAGRDLICVMDRGKTDPSVDMCLARQGSRDNYGRIQMLHYNIERFLHREIIDLRGLETVFIMSLLMLFDANEDRSGASPIPMPKRTSDTPAIPAQVITPEDYEPEEHNEVIVGVTTDLDQHIARATALLEDPNMLFIMIRTKQAEAAARALKVAGGVTAVRHRAGLNELHKYIIEEEAPKRGPRVIKLDAPKGPEAAQWTPPPNLTIYLSTVELPELKPGRRAAAASANASGGGLGTSPPLPSKLNGNGNGNGGGPMRPPPAHPSKQAPSPFRPGWK